MFKKLLVALIFVESLTLALTLATNQPVQRHRRQEASCGVPSTQTGLHLSRIFDGESFDKGAWPWMVALLNRKSTPPKFFCAGTLITNKKVVTGKFRVSSNLHKLSNLLPKPLIAFIKNTTAKRRSLETFCSFLVLMILLNFFNLDNFHLRHLRSSSTTIGIRL